MNSRRDLYISLGTNQGNRERNIKRALLLMNLYFFKRYQALSSIIDTQAVGFDGPDFLNCVVRYSTQRRPESLLRAFKRIERLMGRKDAPEFDTKGSRIYHDRTIDIDILKYGDIEMDTPSLTIPHPRLQDRLFFKELMDSISPQG